MTTFNINCILNERLFCAIKFLSRLSKLDVLFWWRQCRQLAFALECLPYCFLLKPLFARCDCAFCRRFRVGFDAGTCHHRPSTTPKRPHFNMFSISLRRYTPPFAIVSVHQNFCAGEQACEGLSDQLGDASRISAKRTKSMKIRATVSSYSELLAVNGRLSLLVRVCLLHLCSRLCCSVLIRFCWCAVQAKALRCCTQLSINKHSIEERCSCA